MSAIWPRTCLLFALLRLARLLFLFKWRCPHGWYLNPLSFRLPTTWNLFWAAFFVFNLYFLTCLPAALFIVNFLVKAENGAIWYCSINIDFAYWPYRAGGFIRLSRVCVYMLIGEAFNWVCWCNPKQLKYARVYMLYKGLFKCWIAVRVISSRFTGYDLKSRFCIIVTG